MTQTDIENLREVVQAMESVDKNLRVGIECLKGEQIITATTHFYLAVEAYSRTKKRFMNVINNGEHE